jgi:polar amino acid transport system permease protein
MIDFNTTHFLFLLMAARWTVVLSLIAFAGGALIGLALAFLRMSTHRLLAWTGLVIIQLIQGTPLLILIFLSFFGLSYFGYNPDALVVASVAVIVYAGAYFGEIWRGSIQAIPPSQWEAAECLGFGFVTTNLYIILPQAIKIAAPPTVGFMVQAIKNTSLVSVIGFVELTRAGQIVNNSTFQPFSIFLSVAALYFLMCFPLSKLSRALERRLAQDNLSGGI